MFVLILTYLLIFSDTIAAAATPSLWDGHQLTGITTATPLPPSHGSHLGIAEHRSLYGNDRAYRMMGIEFETPDLKVTYKPKAPAGFKFFRHGSVTWVLEEDTFDDKDPSNIFINNLESRSVGGFKKEGVDLTAFEMGVALNGIVDECAVNGGHALFYEQKIMNMLQSNVYVVNKNLKQQWFDVKLKKTKQIKVVPQITYQIGLEYLEQIFKRACDLKSTIIQPFMACMGLIEHTNQVFDASHSRAASNIRAIRRSTKKPDHPAGSTPDQTSETLQQDEQRARLLLECSEVDGIREIKEKLQINQDMIKLLLSKYVSAPYKSISSEKLKGFVLLFSFYWYQLFNNDKSISGEAGLKKYTSIMSRIPFSQLYWQCLSDEDRQNFCRLFDPIIKEWGNSFHLRKYTREDAKNPGHTENVLQRQEMGKLLNQYNGASFFDTRNALSPISLYEWYRSIVEEDRDIRGKIKPDILSPAPGLIPIDGVPYSMGAMDLESSNLPLFEARSYASTSQGRVDEVVKLVYNESKWFFEDLR